MIVADFKMLNGADFLGEVVALTGKADIATVSATKKAQDLVKVTVRNNLKGRPRWTHRGKSNIYSAQVNLRGAKNTPRSGPPGRFTGSLMRGVGGKRTLVPVLGTVTGGVGVGRKENNIKKRKLEEKYPYFEPAVESVRGELAAIYFGLWTTAMKSGRM